MLAVCVSFYLYVYPPRQLLNAYADLHEIWYIYRATYGQLNGVFINPFRQYYQH
jgi:hypothetical protein